MICPSRRVLLASTAAMALSSLGAAPAAEAHFSARDLKLGLATYSFRRLSLDAALKGMTRLGIKWCSIKDAHLALNSTTELRKQVAARFKAAGVTPLSAGTITLENAAACRQAFEYGRDLGLYALVINPTPQMLPEIERLCKEFDLRAAIHNHGPEDNRWPTPNRIMEAIKDLDPRVGLCIDVGHTARAKVDPAQAILDFRDRLHDCHIKDVSSLEARGASGEVEIGRGVLDIPAILRALVKVGFRQHVGIEHEKDAEDPIPGVAESLGYLRGMVAALAATGT